MALVSVELLLQFVNGILVLIVRLAVLFILEGKILETFILLPNQFVGLLVAALFGFEFGFQFADSLFQLGDDLLATLER